MLYSHIRQYICKNTKNIQKSDFMDGFCLQGELDLTLFYKIEGYFDNPKSLMTLMTGLMNTCTHIYQGGSLLVMSKLPNYLKKSYLFNRKF